MHRTQQGNTQMEESKWDEQEQPMRRDKDDQKQQASMQRRASKREIELHTHLMKQGDGDSQLHPVHRMEKITKDINNLVAEREEQARIRQMQEDQADTKQKSDINPDQRSASNQGQTGESKDGPAFVPSQQKSSGRKLKRSEEDEMQEDDNWGSERRGSKMDRARSSGSRSGGDKRAASDVDDRPLATDVLINDADVTEQARISAQEQLRSSSASLGGAGSSTAVRHKQMLDDEVKSFEATKAERAKQKFEDWRTDEANQVDRERSTLRQQIGRVVSSITGTKDGAHQPIQQPASDMDRKAESWTTHNIRTHGDVPTSMTQVKTSPAGVEVAHTDRFKSLESDESIQLLADLPPSRDSELTPSRGKMRGRLGRLEGKIENGLEAAKDKVGEWKDDVGDKWSDLKHKSADIKHKIAGDDDKGKVKELKGADFQWSNRGTIELPIPTGASIVGSNKPSATNNKGDKPGEADRVARIAAVHPRSQLDYKPAEMGGNLPPSESIQQNADFKSGDMSLRDKADIKFRDLESDMKQRGRSFQAEARDDLNKMASKGREWKEDLRDDAKSLEKRAVNLKDDVKNKIESVGDDVKNKIESVGDDVKGKLGEIEGDVMRGVDKIESTFSNEKGDEMDPVREEVTRVDQRWSDKERTAERPGLMQRVRSWWSPSTWRKAQVEAERTARKEAAVEWHTDSNKPDMPHPHRTTKWALDNAANYSVRETAEAMQERLDELRRVESDVPHPQKSLLSSEHEKHTLAADLRTSLANQWKEIQDAQHDWEDTADSASSAELDSAPSSPRSPLFLDKSRPQLTFSSMPHPSHFSPSLSDVSPSNGVDLHQHSYSRKFPMAPSSGPTIDLSDAHFDQIGFGAIMEPW